MPTFRESMWPIVAIILTSAVLIAAIMPLAQTEWAEGIRLGLELGGNGEPFTGDREPFAVIGIIASMIKITLLMGIPGLITIGVQNLTKGKSAKINSNSG